MGPSGGRDHRTGIINFRADAARSEYLSLGSEYLVLTSGDPVNACTCGYSEKHVFVECHMSARSTKKYSLLSVEYSLLMKCMPLTAGHPLLVNS